MEQLTFCEGLAKWVIILCMVLTQFPALTDLICISEKRLSNFLLVLAQCKNIIQLYILYNLKNTVDLIQIFDCHLTIVTAQSLNFYTCYILQLLIYIPATEWNQLFCSLLL